MINMLSYSILDEDEKEGVIVKKNRPDIDEIETFPREQKDIDWWSFPTSFLQQATDEVDAVLNTLDNKTFLFSGNRLIEYDHAHRWWSEPMTLEEKWDDLPEELKTGTEK